MQQRKFALKVIGTFHEIFVQDENKNKRNKYDVTFLEADSDDKTLSTTIDKYIDKNIKKRSTQSRIPLGINTIIENQLGPNVAIEYRRSGN